MNASPTRLLTDRETATLLAALRYWQREGLMSGGHECDIATDGGQLQALSPEEIDDLCERINRRPAAPRAALLAEEAHRYRNFYEHCGQQWDDTWSCQCNDRCPVCNSEIEPYESAALSDEGIG